MDSRRTPPLLAVLPLVLVVLLATISSSDERALDAPSEPLVRGRLVVVIVDSLRAKALDAHMPRIKAYGALPESVRRDVRTCTANFTLPCIQTLLEGRQSPFVAGVHNFTGRRGGAQSLPAIGAKAGLTQVMISDYTIPSLYGHLTPQAIDTDKSGLPTYLERDQHAVKLATRALSVPDTDVVYLHIVGTDKVAHHKLPGHPEYVAHFEAVDVALSELTGVLDPERDHILITGDHGHSESGHHTRDSVAIINGPLWREVLDGSGATLEQPDLTALLASTFALPLPADAESHVLGATIKPKDPELAAHWATFIERQQEVFVRAGFDGEGLVDSERSRDAWLKGKSASDASRYVLFLPLLLSWLVAFLATHVGLRKRLTALFGIPALALALWGIVPMLPPLATTLSAACLSGALMWWVATRALSRVVHALCVTALLSIIPALLGDTWADMFHSTGSFGAQVPLFFAVCVACGAILSWVLCRRFVARLPHGVALIALMALPSGVYYYQYGQNILQGLILGGALSLIASLARAPSRATLWSALKPTSVQDVLASILVPLCGALLLAQHAGGWAWGLHVRDSLRWAPAATSGAVIVILLLAISALLPHWRARLAATSYALVVGAFGVLVAHTPLHVFAVGLIPCAFFVAAHRSISLCREEAATSTPHGAHLLEALLTWACVQATAWVMLEGFFISNVDFQFALDIFSELPPAQVAAFSGLAVVGKYGAPLLFPAILYRLMSPSRWEQGAHVMLALALLKLLCLGAFILFAPLFSVDKTYEVAISDFLFVYGMAALLWALYAMVRTGSLCWRLVLERAHQRRI